MSTSTSPSPRPTGDRGAGALQPVFRDQQLEDAFNERGYVVVDALDRDRIAALVDLHATTHGIADGFRHSMQHGASDQKARIRSAIVETYESCIARFLTEHSVITCAFLIKGPRGDSTFPGHLDWSFVDESRHRSVNAWVALCDTTPENGALAVLPGSHRLPLTLRGSCTPPPLRASPDALWGLLEVVPVRAGQVILYDGRMIHGSASNTSGRPRLAAGMCLVPAGVSPVHYVGDRGGDGTPIREFLVDPAFFHAYAVDPELGHDPHIEALTEGRASREVAATPPLTLKDLQALGPGRGWARRARSVRRRFKRR